MATSALGLDLSRRFGSIEVDLTAPGVVPVEWLEAELVHAPCVTLAAAEAAGVAQWCLETAVDYAKVREQFGQTIGSFQAIKHLCAEMLETTESVAAVAWDVAHGWRGEDDGGGVHRRRRRDRGFDGAVTVGQGCIQVLGGIGFTFEHDAHLYLRRAVALRAWRRCRAVGRRLAGRAGSGQRRAPEIDFGGADAGIRETAAGEDGPSPRCPPMSNGPRWPRPAT